MKERETAQTNSGIGDYEAVIGAFATRIAQKERIRPKEIEEALRPHTPKAHAFERLLLLGALEPLDGKGKLTEKWLLSLTELEYNLLKSEEMRQNPGMVDPVTLITEAVAQRFKLEGGERAALRTIVKDCLDGTVLVRFLQDASAGRT
jgi:hypothetical protein